MHLAGLIKAPRRDDFMRANRDGTRHLAEARRRASAVRICFTCRAWPRAKPSVSRTTPRASAPAEQAAIDVLGARLSILRPPAVYGPGDRETLAFFQDGQPAVGAVAWRCAGAQRGDPC
jgi:nucleoside-diphosphate-sugar epimerase